MSATQTASGLSVGIRCARRLGAMGRPWSPVGQTHGLEAPPFSLRQTQLPHQTANAPASATMPAFLQPAHHARAAVFAAAFGVRRRDQRQKLHVGAGAGARLAPDPCVIAAARNIKGFAHLADGVMIVHGLHALKTLPSADRMPSVFFRMSRWRQTCCNSRLSRRFSSSSCSAERCPRPVAGSAASFFFHCLRLCVLMPSSAAMVSTDLPPWSSISTAERFKFSSYRLCLPGAGFSVFMVSCSLAHTITPTLSTNSRQGQTQKYFRERENFSYCEPYFPFAPAPCEGLSGVFPP